MMNDAIQLLASRALRGIASVIMGLMLTGVMTPALSSATYATPAWPVPQQPVTLVLHKFHQPDHLGHPATGLPLDDGALADLQPVAGVEFIITKVPDIDVTTVLGRGAAQDLELPEALQKTAVEQPTDSGVTGTDGKLIIDDVPVGVYLVEETSTPAGVVPTDPFLVMLPMRHPTDQQWLSTVYIYPKNAPVDITLTVDDQAAVQPGDDIQWHMAASIPAHTKISRYSIEHSMAQGVRLDHGLENIGVRLSTGTKFVAGTDYTINVLNAAGSGGFRIDFTKAGIAKLTIARQQDPTAEALVDYMASVTAAGQHTNQAQLFVNDAEAIQDTATTKFGPLDIIVHARNHPDHRIENVKIAVYRSAEDALADRNPLVIHGRDHWVTDANGTVSFDSLRFSDFVNGLDRDPTDPLFRYYYVKPLDYPTGWTGETASHGVVVNSAKEHTTLLIEAWRTNASAAPPSNPGDQSPASTPPGEPADGDLATTGTRLAGLLILAAALTAVGMIVRNRRRTQHNGVSS